MSFRIVGISAAIGLAALALSGCVDEYGYYGGYSGYSYGPVLYDDYGPGPYYGDYYAPVGGVYYGGYYGGRRYRRDRDDHGRDRDHDHWRGRGSDNPSSHSVSRTRYRLVEHPHNDLYPARPGRGSTSTTHHRYRLETNQ